MAPYVRRSFCHGAAAVPVALIHSSEMKTFADLFAEYIRNASLIAAAGKAGVAALLLQSSRPRGLLYRHPMSFDGSLVPVPAAIVSREHAGLLARLAETNEVRVRLNLTNKLGGEYESQNVVAEIRGREKPARAPTITASMSRSCSMGPEASNNLGWFRAAPSGSFCSPAKSKACGDPVAMSSVIMRSSTNSPLR